MIDVLLEQTKTYNKAVKSKSVIIDFELGALIGIEYVLSAIGHTIVKVPKSDIDSRIQTVWVDDVKYDIC